MYVQIEILLFKAWTQSFYELSVGYTVPFKDPVLATKPL